MTESIDHAAEARRMISFAKSEAGATIGATIAQAHATLALVEQQRIANLIALATFTASNPDAQILPVERAAWLAIAEDGTGHPTALIREGLGL